MKKEMIRRLEAALLAAVLVFTCLPGAVFAGSLPEEGAAAAVEESFAEEPEESLAAESPEAEPETGLPEESFEAEAEESLPEESSEAEAEESLPEESSEAEPEESFSEESPAEELPAAEDSPAEEPEDPAALEDSIPEDAESEAETAEEILETAAEAQPARSAVIEDGLYLIESALSADLVLEIQADSLANRGNAALGTRTGDFRQAFYIESCGDESYILRNYNSGLVVDVNGGMSANGTNIQQYAANGSDAQKWKINENEDGSLTFISVKNGKAMDVAGARKAAGTNVQIYAANGTPAQSWHLAALCGVTETFERLEDGGLADGYYRILSSKNSKMCLGIADSSRAECANAALYAVDGAAASVFKVTSLGSGLYKIAAAHSGKVLDLQGGSVKNGTNIRQYTSNGTAAQQWYIRKDPSTGFYAILSGKNERTSADIAGGLSSSGTNVRAYRFNGTAAQFWQFEATDAAVIGDKVAEGLFRILPASVPSCALSIAGASLNNGGNAALADYSAGNEQVFSFSKNDDGTWTVLNINSGKVLDIYGGLRRCGANVQQYTSNGTAAQKIAFVPTGDADNSYTLLVYGTMAFDVAGAKLRAGTNVQLYTPNGTAAQAFVLEAAEAADGWIYDAAGRRWYVKGGSKLTGWQTINGKTYYIDSTKGLLTSQIVDGYEVDANGVRGKRVRTVLNSTINGKRTLKTFLQNALVPAGRTLYIWGGGWGGLGTDSSNDSAKIGYLPGWQAFYDSHSTAGYEHSNYRWAYGCGLDCSGFVAWAVYNTAYTANNLKDIVVQSTSVAPSYINWGWAYQNMSSYRPGDVVSMSGHVWISLGKCSDGSVLLVHSSPKGVQLSGTGGKSVQLAAKYMNILAPDWPYAIRTVDYLSHTTSKATWIVNGNGLFTDPDRIQGMSAEDVMRTLIGS